MDKFSKILLFLFVGMAVILNFLPHLNYEYPLHVDEWVHYQYSNYLSSGSPLYFGQNYNSLEAGFHYFLAVLNSIGIPYLFMFKFFPSFFTLLICLGVFIFTRKIWNERAGLFSVLFIALLKSTVEFLGPIFLVPMALGLFFLMIGLYLVEIKSNLWVLILTFLLIMHPPTALAFFILINISFLIKKKDYLKNLLLQCLAGIIAFPLYLPRFIEKGTETINSLVFNQIISLAFIPRYLGWFAIIFVLIGIYFSFKEKRRDLTLFSIALLIFIAIAYQLKIEFFIPAPRAMMYLFMIFAVVFGIGCEKLSKISNNKKVRILIFLLIIFSFISLTLPKRIDSNDYLYHIANEKDVNAFNWIKDNTNKNSIVLADPWKANALTPIAEREVYSRIVQGPSGFYEKRNNEIYAFFQGNCTNITFLDQNDISAVYGSCNSTNLKNVYTNVYVR
jgi:hypothetical protein